MVKLLTEWVHFRNGVKCCRCNVQLIRWLKSIFSDLSSRSDSEEIHVMSDAMEVREGGDSDCRWSGRQWSVRLSHHHFAHCQSSWIMLSVETLNFRHLILFIDSASFINSPTLLLPFINMISGIATKIEEKFGSVTNELGNTSSVGLSTYLLIIWIRGVYQHTSSYEAHPYLRDNSDACYHADIHGLNLETFHYHKEIFRSNSDAPTVILQFPVIWFVFSPALCCHSDTRIWDVSLGIIQCCLEQS